jgi:predicted PilT family ATPase
MVIIVPKHAIGKVIGKGGKTIEDLGKEHRCKVDFLRSYAHPNGDTPLEIRSLRNVYSDVAALAKKFARIVSFFYK